MLSGDDLLDEGIPGFDQLVAEPFDDSTPVAGRHRPIGPAWSDGRRWFDLGEGVGRGSSPRADGEEAASYAWTARSRSAGAGGWESP